jgi:hypothetical protein
MREILHELNHDGIINFKRIELVNLLIYILLLFSLTILRFDDLADVIERAEQHKKSFTML